LVTCRCNGDAGKGIELVVALGAPAHIHHCKMSCDLSPDICKPDGRSSLGS
jgi:hypothetical protein